MKASLRRPSSVMRVLSPRIEPPEIFEDGSIGEHGDLVARVDQMQAEGFDEGRLADARRPGDAEADRFAGLGQQEVEQLLGRQPVIRRAAIRPA